jgi:hypothetical protein
MGRRRWVILAVVAVVAFAVAFFVASEREDDADDAGSELALDDLEALSVEARELVARVEQGALVTHHAVYEQSGGHRFEVWTDGERVREETTPADGERRLLLRTDGEAISCIEDDDEWSCDEPVEAAPGLQDRLDQLVADLIGAEVAISDATIADVEVECFDITGDEDLQICVTPAGIVARLAAGGDEIELVTLDDDVDDDDFDAPE